MILESQSKEQATWGCIVIATLISLSIFSFNGKTEHYYVYFLSILSVLLFLIAQLHLTYYFVQ